MHPKLASLYMLALAEAMALQRGAQPITDDTLSHLAMGGFTMQRLAEALLDDIVEPQPRSDHEIEEQMAGLTLEMVVPASLDSVPASKLFAFRDRDGDESRQPQGNRTCGPLHRDRDMDVAVRSHGAWRGSRCPERLACVA